MTKGRLAVVVAVAALSFPLTLAGQGEHDAAPEPEAARLSRSPWDSARAGDWSILAGNAQARGSERAQSVRIITTVVNVKENQVEVDHEPIDGNGVSSFISRAKFPVSPPPTILELFAPAPDAKLANVIVAEAAYSVGGRTFACRRISCTTTAVGPNGFASESSLVVWLAPEVRGGGRVAVHSKTVERGAVVEWRRLEVASFGNSQGKEWGSLTPDMR